jgi:hypothetical protein
MGDRIFRSRRRNGTLVETTAAQPGTHAAADGRRMHVTRSRPGSDRLEGIGPKWGESNCFLAEFVSVMRQ